LTLFENSGRTITRDAFTWSSTVFARLIPASNSKCYRIEWRDPSNTVVKTTDFNPTSGNIDDSFNISASGPSGVWTVNVYEGPGNGSCIFSTPQVSQTFDVARAVILFAPSPSPAPTSLADSYVAQDSPGTNFGTASTLVVDKTSSSQEKRAFLRFDLSGISGTVTSAKLRMLISSINNSGAGRSHD